MVEQLRQKAIDWYAADKEWRTSVGIIKGEYLCGVSTENTPEKAKKQNAAAQYRISFEDFFNLYQELDRHLKPFIKN